LNTGKSDRRVGRLSGNVFDVVDAVFRKHLKASAIDPDGSLIEYGLDSVRSIELIVELEALFDMDISDEEAAKFRTVRSAADHIAGRIQ
jgi:acyl carrier protein